MNAVVSERSQFEENLSMLAMVAMRDVEADGFAYFRRDNERGRFCRAGAFGISIPEERVSPAAGVIEGSPLLICHPLRFRGITDGLLAFAFTSAVKAGAAPPRLAGHIAGIGKLWAVPALLQVYFGTLQRIAELETELIHSKIATVARGALEGGGGRESSDVVIRHVETVLRSSNTRRCLDNILQELMAEVEERSWVGQAKEILHEARGMREWEAHSHLRKLSRQSRRPLLDVARQVVHDAGFGDETGAEG